MKRFDRKFGRDFLSELPQAPAVYLFKGEDGEVLYAGKAKNVRRRLAQYRNASRRKAHRKMRTLVREAESLEVRVQESEAEALLIENQLIREHRPRYNVDGAFDFLYPAIGTGLHEGRVTLCFTTDPDHFAPLGLRWHGAFRPRWRAREAFDALLLVFGRLGHREPRSRLPMLPARRGSVLALFRRVPAVLLDSTRRFIDGEDDALLRELFEPLLESRDARRDAARVEEALRALEDFHVQDAVRLRRARLATGHVGDYVPAAERDALFIRARSARSEGPALNRARS